MKFGIDCLSVLKYRRTSMFKKFFKQLAADSVVFSVHPSTIEDPLAQKTEWIPLKSGGSNVKTAEMHRVSDTRIEFRGSATMKLLAIVFAVGGPVSGFFMMRTMSFSMESLSHGSFWLPVVFILLFGYGGLSTLYVSLRPTVFDKDAGYFWKSFRKPPRLMSRAGLKQFTPLSEIHALQLIAEKCSGGQNQSAYFSYELNLVLKDGSRRNVLDHGSLGVVRKDAQELAAFINRPIWDTI
jgi:hypothetical protein